MNYRNKREEFKNPSAAYRMKTILHGWPERTDKMLDAMEAFGYGGTATNPSFQNGYTKNPENLKKFGEVIEQIRERGLNYWIYDENGYPSGYAGGQTLDGHPEYEAKGFYMVRRIAYEPTKAVFDLDDVSDRIIWAAKYPLDCTTMNASIVQYEKMEPLPFTQKHCECELKAEEVFFVFCVKSAYEGTHCVHNVCSRSRYINIMDAEAVKYFLEVNYEPIARNVPEAYQNAEAVFTDEPSLMVGYIHGDETWPHALAPWTEGLFELFEQEYGFSILPYLPMIFEGRDSSYSIRVKFYELVGKIIARNYVQQISDWCKAHGTTFSGHYLAEESLQAHVIYYGSYLEVLKASGYPGVDILASYPEIYNYNTPKFAQMAARKNGTDGMMVELCPFIKLDHFRKNPVLYARGILNLMILNGCRSVNSYFAPDFAGYDPEYLGNYHGYMSQEEGKALNDYVGRLFCMLEGVSNQTEIFVYYAIEEAQAKTRPSHCAIEASSSEVDRSLNSLTKKIYKNGYDFQFCDREDLVHAARSLKAGSEKPAISGMSVKHIILPAMDVIYEESMEALRHLKEAGVCVWFADKLPKFRAEQMAPFAYYDFREESALLDKRKEDGVFTAASEDEIIAGLGKDTGTAFGCCSGNLELHAENAESGVLLKAKYIRDGKPFYFVINNSEADVYVRWNWDGVSEAEIWNPENGKITVHTPQENITIHAYQGVFFYE